MQRRLRLISTILASCLAIVMLGFGVYAALTQVTYNIEGTISYNVTDTYVEVNTKIYKSETLLTKAQLVDKVEQVANLSFADISSDTSLTHLTALDDTFTNVSSLSGAGEYSKGEDLDFTFATSGENVAFAYFIVMNVANLTQNPIYAVMQDDILDVTNTFQHNNALQENILSTEDNRNIVIGIIVDDRTTPIAENSPFSYGINIGSGNIAESEFMTAKYDATNGYANAKGVVVIDPNVNSGSFTGLSGSNVSAVFVSEGIESVPEASLYGSKVKKIVLSDSVKNFGAAAFSECEGLTSITIPDGVTSISDFAFSGCIGLESITLPDSVLMICNEAFSGCTSLTSIIIPDSVTSIDTIAFRGCTGLTSITIPNSVESIGSDAFGGCTNLRTLNYNANITTSYTSSNSPFKSFGSTVGVDVVIGVDGDETDISIPDYLFYNNANIKSVEIKDNVTSIGSYAFSNCKGLKEATMADSVTTIEEFVFDFCTSLKKIKFSSNIEVLPQSTLYECAALTDLTLPQDLKGLGNFALFGCSSLTTLNLPDGLITIGEESLVGCAGITSLTIPDNVETIKMLAFNGWTEEQSIYFEGTSMPENLESDWNDGCNAKIYLNGELWTGA